MKIKSNYVLREVGDQFVVVPTGIEAIKFNGIITLNKTGKRLFKQLQEEVSETNLIDYLQSVYDVDKTKASEDVLDFINILKDNDLLD
jgi:hypothetical protein